MAGDANMINVVTFTPTGATTLTAAGSIQVCKTGQTAKVVSVAVSGRIRVGFRGVCS